MTEDMIDQVPLESECEKTTPDGWRGYVFETEEDIAEAEGRQ